MKNRGLWKVLGKVEILEELIMGYSENLFPSKRSHVDKTDLRGRSSKDVFLTWEIQLHHRTKTGQESCHHVRNSCFLPQEYQGIAGNPWSSRSFQSYGRV